MRRLINWFEIPVVDMERAVGFYEAVLGIRFSRQSNAEMDLAVFPYPADATGGALCRHARHQPSPSGGVVVYLDGGEDLAVPLGRVPEAGGQIVMAKTLICPDIGYMGFFRDSEGNVVALHSPR